MQKLNFAESVDKILAETTQFDREAYFFLKDALDFTAKLRKRLPKRSEGGTAGDDLDYTAKLVKKGGDEVGEHVTGQQLLEGIRQYALKNYGPMVVTVFHYWNIRRCEDFGALVYSLIKVGAFGKTSTDRIEDFRSIYSFEEAFVTPFKPEKPTLTPRLLAPAGEPARRE